MSLPGIQYDVFWGYGPLTLNDWIDQSKDMASSIKSDLLCLQQDRGHLYTKTVYAAPGMQPRVSRKSQFEPMTSIGKALEQARVPIEQCGIYIFDEAFSRQQEPEIFVNLYVTRSGMISGRRLQLPSGDAAGTFLICGVATSITRTFPFQALATKWCKALQLQFAYLFRNVGYEYDGKTPLEWAYKNHSARLKTGQLEDIETSVVGLRLA